LTNDKRTFKISTYRKFCYSQEFPGIIKAKNFIDGLVVDIDLNVSSKKPTPLQFSKNVASPDGVPINKNKIADLKQFEMHIPPRYIKFYQWKTTDVVQDEYQNPNIFL